MLMKPPSIFDDVVSQDSENYTVHSKQQSLKGKQPKKENTIRIGQPQDNRQKSFERDNESVHSNGSKRSKDKRAKQSTLARPKITEAPSYRDEDNHSVHSNGSRHSQKSAKKENNIMQRPKIQQPYAKSKPSNNISNELSFKNAIGDPEESVIKRYKLDSQESPQPVRYVQEKVKPVQKIQQKNKKYAPFAEIQHKQSSQEEIPIFRIEEPPKKSRQNVVGLTRPDDNRFIARIEEKRDAVEPRQVFNTEQSSSVFDQSKMANTKSQRRPIFGRDQLNNSSKVSNAIEQSNVSGIDSSRRKSNSKLRQLFNNSRQKGGLEQSNMDNQSRMSSFGDLVSQSRAIKPAVGTNERMVQLERKVVDPQNDNFGVDSIKSNLDLTVSNNQHLADKERDSLIFEFEPERKKGMSVTSKNKKLNSSEQELIKIGGQLTSAKPKGIKETTQSLPQLKAATIESKDLKHVDKLLKENQQFLRSSALLNLSQSDKLKRDSGDDYLFKLQDDEPDIPIFANALNTPWNQPARKEEVLNIKKVERNQKLPIKEKQKITENKPKQEIVMPRQPQIQVNAVAKEKTENKRGKLQQQQIFLKKQPQYLSKPQLKEEVIKSPGKIAKNYDSVPLIKDETDNKSEKSNKSAKKGKSIKESAIPRDKAKKIEIRNDGPRADESFYQEEPREKKEEPSINDLSLYSKKAETKQQKKANVYRFSDDENEANEKPKSRTDINFYDNQARSNKPPSSRPPLSGKSAKSRSTSKDKVPKQTTIKIGSNQPAKNPFKKTEQPPTKKLTLMERAMMKHNESSEEDRSQQSFSSRQDFSQNSRKSSNSKGSRKSIKETTIKIDKKQNSLVKNGSRPPYQRKVSSNSSHQEQMQQIQANQRQRSIEQHKNMIANQRAIVSKNCTFIDQKGRLVQKDLIIKGKEVYGQSRIEDSTVQALERMKRTKQSRRSRSKSRERNQKRRSSRDEGESSSYQNSSYCSSFYDNSSYARNTGSKANAYNNTGSIYTGGSQPQALRQFMKPVEQVPLYNQANNERRPQRYVEQQTRTFNDMFSKKTQNQNYGQTGMSNVSESRSRRSLKRTQTSARKR